MEYRSKSELWKMSLRIGPDHEPRRFLSGLQYQSLQKLPRIRNGPEWRSFRLVMYNLLQKQVRLLYRVFKNIIFCFSNHTCKTFETCSILVTRSEMQCLLTTASSLVSYWFIFIFFFCINCIFKNHKIKVIFVTCRKMPHWVLTCRIYPVFYLCLKCIVLKE